ncbi:YciI family protein [Nocardioides cheoyonin]|uniref:YciI family protein n=1 Tax=Nocardioides cheoyonin TaxID=3156615 RepID=UPI0032B492D3
MPRYLLIVDNQLGNDTSGGMSNWAPEVVAAHLDYYAALSKALEASGELVVEEALTPPDQAHVVTSNGTDTTVIDGPFQEFKEWVAGYTMVDVESEERALEIAAQLSAVPGPNGPIEQPIQVRRMYHGADPDQVRHDYGIA